MNLPWVRWLRRCALVGVLAAGLGLLAAQYGAVYVAGRSMEPGVSPGDLAVYRRGGRPATAGDVVVVRDGGSSRLVVHRVVEVKADGGFVTRGDASARADLGCARPQDVSGVVVGVLPLGRAIGAAVAGLRWCYNRLPIANTRL